MPPKKKKTGADSSKPNKKKSLKKSNQKSQPEEELIEEKEEASSEKEESTKKKEERKIIYIEIDDEVTSIYDRIKSVKQKNVYLVIPKRAIIFQSVVNLKILKRKSEDLGKQLSIITSDDNGTHLANLIELPVYESVHTDLEQKPGSMDNDDPHIAPLKATGNILQDEAPTRLKERKLSISEFLHSFRERHGIKTTSIKRRGKKPAESLNEKKKSRFVFVAPNRQALISLIIASLMIFLVISYIALPGATIYLTPKSTVLEKSVNVTFADYTRNLSEFNTHPDHMIATYTANETLSKSLSQAATGKIFKGTNASGFLMIINESNRDWPLIARTRFQNSEGIVFRLGGFVTVPANGSLKVPVVADEFDAYGQIVGERGNLQPGNFFLPGLREENRLSLYAKSEEQMTGGKTDFIKTVREEDIAAAENLLREELKKAATEALKAKVVAQGKEQSSDAQFELLVGDKAIRFSEPRISIPSDLVGKQLDQFELHGEIDVSGVYFNKAELVEVLRNELLLKRSPEKKVVKVNDDSIVYSIFDEDTSAKKLRVTASIKGIEEYDIDPKRENGRRLSKIIKDHIVGKKVSDAVSYIQNLPEINKVEIENWPGWAPTIPSVADNIEIVLVEKG